MGGGWVDVGLAIDGWFMGFVLEHIAYVITFRISTCQSLLRDEYFYAQMFFYCGFFLGRVRSEQHFGASLSPRPKRPWSVVSTILFSIIHVTTISHFNWGEENVYCILIIIRF